ncbi:MAG: hypothetical protein EBT26_00995 [Microbacteriaceae bacterium]|nr:hypothetical protein [Microbacteriaceae bacterium]NBS60623.1 hypothetical protein [Microbacteriaceae bacterium]
MPKRDWWYVDTWVDPKAQIAKIATESQYAAGTPKISFYSRTVLLRPVLQDLEEGLHSLIQENTCSCGLRIKKSDNLLAIIDSKHHRNHITLEPEPNPKFRGLVARRIAAPFLHGNDAHPVDMLWDRIINSA